METALAEYRDHTGKLLGITRTGDSRAKDAGVYDSTGAFVGSVGSGATREADGRFLMTGDNASALLFSRVRQDGRH
jgi:hypothetical protein